MFSVLQFWWSSSFKSSKTHLNLIPTHKTQTKSNSQRKIKEINNKGEANLHLDQNLGWKLIGCAAYLILQIVARDVKSWWWKEAGTLDCCGAIEREREREMGGSLKEWERDESELWRSFSLFNPQKKKKKSMSDKYLLYLKNTYTYQTRNCVFFTYENMLLGTWYHTHFLHCEYFKHVFSRYFLNYFFHTWKLLFELTNQIGPWRPKFFRICWQCLLLYWPKFFGIQFTCTRFSFPIF